MKRSELPAVVMVSTDTSILKEGSAAHQRMREYGTLFAELHIVLFTRTFGKRAPRMGGAGKGVRGALVPATIQIGQNVLVHSTQSWSRWCFVRDGVRVGRAVLARLLKRTPSTQIVISTQDPFETGLVGKRLAQEFGVALQVQVHTDFLSPYFCWPTCSFAGILNRFRRRIARAVLAQAASVRVVSERIRKSLVGSHVWHPDHIQVLPIYVDPFAWALSRDRHARVGGEKEADWVHLPHWDTVGLMACRLTKEKQVDLALRAFAKAVKVAPKTGLIIAGEGPERPHLERLARKLGIEHHVLFVGWQRRLLPFFHSVDFLLSTSLFEGYGMTMVEAMLAGVPVISSDTGIAGELLIDGRNGYVFSRSHESSGGVASGAVGLKEAENQLFTKMTKLIMHPELRKQFGEHAARDARKHAYPSHAAYLKAYREGVLMALDRHA